MDELEISGKRYISTKRAGKEHGYHSDYIGQLIRGKKVTGQKVGRAWYVEQVSLADYLGKEAPAETAAPIVEEEVEVPAPVVKEKVAERSPDVLVGEPTSDVGFEEKVIEPVEEIKEEPKIVYVEKVIEVKPQVKIVEPVIESPIEIKKEKTLETADGYRVAIHTPAPTLGGLKYVEDTEPLLPHTGERAVTARMERAQHIAEPMEEESPKNKFSLLTASLVVVFGLALFAATAVACGYTSSKLVLKEGQTATVNYAFNF